MWLILMNWICNLIDIENVKNILNELLNDLYVICIIE